MIGTILIQFAMDSDSSIFKYIRICSLFIPEIGILFGYPIALMIEQNKKR